MERGKFKKKKELARKKMEAAVPLLRSQKHTKQKVDDDGSLCVSLNTVTK